MIMTMAMTMGFKGKEPCILAQCSKGGVIRVDSIVLFLFNVDMATVSFEYFLLKSGTDICNVSSLLKYLAQHIALSRRSCLDIRDMEPFAVNFGGAEAYRKGTIPYCPQLLARAISASERQLISRI
jgi:hypothetical protein